jgi:RNA recognition motif-containing protein
MQPSQPNPKKLYVGNLPFSMTKIQVEEMCAEIGDVAEVNLIIDRATGRSKGFAFVEFATEEKAKEAIQALNGRDIDGRKLQVMEARPPQPRENRPFNNDRRGGGGYGGGDNGGYRGRGGGSSYGR